MRLSKLWYLILAHIINLVYSLKERLMHDKLGYLILADISNLA
jgi:hypothetical protein